MEPIPPQGNSPQNVPPGSPSNSPPNQAQNAPLNTPSSSPPDSSKNVFKVIPEAKAAPGLSGNPLPSLSPNPRSGSSEQTSGAALNPGLIKPTSSASASSPVSSPASLSLGSKKFLSGKLFVALIATVVLGGGIAAGYFIFPEQFYNTVGKYIGLPAPTGVGEEKTNEDDAREPTESDTANASMLELFKELPGEDANVLIALRPTKELKTHLNELISDVYGANSKVFGYSEDKISTGGLRTLVRTVIEDMKKYLLLEEYRAYIDEKITKLKLLQKEEPKPTITNPDGLDGAIPRLGETPFEQILAEIERLEEDKSATVMSISIQKEGDTLKFIGKMADFMKDDEDASLQTKRNEKATKNLPPELQEFFELKVTQDKNVVTTDLTIKDLKALTEKLIEMIMAFETVESAESTPSLDSETPEFPVKPNDSSTSEKIKRPR